MRKATIPSKTAAKPAVHGSPALHYSKEALLKDYQQTYGIFMKALTVGVIGALVYFFVFITYLGGWSHTKADDYAKEFNSRYPQDYSGLKLPEFGGPAHPPAHSGAQGHE